MDFNQFQFEFYLQLKSNNKNYLKFVNDNEQLIEDNLGDNGNPQTINEFINEINNIILDNNNNLITIVIDGAKNINTFTNNKFELIEKVLNHNCFSKVLSEFKNSNVLLRACKDGNKDAIKWLLTMNISPYIKDENEINALMYAAQQNLDFAIKPFFHDRLCINMEDNHGDNVLIYSLRASKTQSNNEFLRDLIYNSEIDINHYNHKGETALLYCIKYDIMEPFRNFLISNQEVDVNIADSDGMTAAMYLTEKGYHQELYQFHDRKFNYDYVNYRDESVISILMDKMYSEHNSGSDSFINYAKILNTLVLYQYDFNFPIGKDDNTPFMIMLIVNDVISAKFCAKCLKKLDLSMKNKYGENATSLCYKLNRREILNSKYFKNNITLNYSYRDSMNQNTLVMISAINNSSAMKEILENEPELINEVNYKNENALIIASKINKIDAVEILLKHGIDVNHQDGSGNTALHYAVEIRSPYLVHRIMSKKPNIHIKNNEGQSPIDYAHDIEEEDQRELFSNLLQNQSYNLNNCKFNNSVSTKYEEEIHNYILPCANNEYPEFKTKPEIEKIEKEIYNKSNKMNKRVAIITFICIPLLFLINLKIN